MRAAANNGAMTEATEAITAGCLWLRGFLSLEDQLELAEHIDRHDRTPVKPRPMDPQPRTLILGDDGGPSLSYAFGETSVVNRMVERCNEHLKSHANLHVLGVEDITRYSAIKMATISYEAPNGSFPPHVDHCNDGSLVYLASLGQTANFTIKSPSMAEVRRLKFRSGDILIFDAGSDASILHGVVSIDEAAPNAPTGALATRFPVFRNHRYGVQCRVFRERQR